MRRYVGIAVKKRHSRAQFPNIWPKKKRAGARGSRKGVWVMVGCLQGKTGPRCSAPVNERLMANRLDEIGKLPVATQDFGGLARNRTGVQGFAVLCVATPPRGRRRPTARSEALIARKHPPRQGEDAGLDHFLRRGGNRTPKRNKSLCNSLTSCYKPVTPRRDPR